MKRLLSGVSLLLLAMPAMASWEDYCVGAKKFSPEIPAPNYRTSMVLKAAEKLSRVHGRSFVLYSDIQKVYGQCYGAKAEKDECAPSQVRGKPEDVTVDAHNFLTILCSEFRDNEELMTAKLKWVSDMIIVPKGEQSYSPVQGFWEQLTSEGYLALVNLSQKLYDLREGSKAEYLSYGTEELDQLSVPALTECEYRFLLAEYISKGITSIKSLEKYQTNFEKFKETDQCSIAEKSNYNEFRGDGNFKPHSLESNAFIWNTRAFSRNCTNPTTAAPSSILTDQDCKNYYSSPFSARKDLTLKGMYRLFFYHPSMQQTMDDYGDGLVFITDDLNGDNVSEIVTLDNLSNNSNDLVNNTGGYVKALRDTAQSLKKSKQQKQAEVYEDVMKSVVLRAAIAELKKAEIPTSEIERVLMITESQLGKKLPIMTAQTSENLKKIVSNSTEIEKANQTVLPVKAKIEEITAKIAEIVKLSETLTNAIAAQNAEEIAQLEAKRQEFYKQTPANYTAATEIFQQIEELKRKGTPKQVKTLDKYDEEKSQLETELQTLSDSISPLLTKIDELTSENGELNDSLPALELLAEDFKQLAKMVQFPGVTLDLSIMPGWERSEFEKQSDKGFFSVFDDKGEAWKRLATVLDRHTDWYQIDMMVLKLGLYQPTYSPWVASSYYIHESDNFTKPGYAMGMEGDGHRHWMFVQQVPLARWYKASDLKAGVKFDLLNTWFDETTFSTSELGAREKGWDRFGSGAPDELRALVYLYEIGSDNEANEE